MSAGLELLSASIIYGRDLTLPACLGRTSVSQRRPTGRANSKSGGVPVEGVMGISCLLSCLKPL